MARAAGVPRATISRIENGRAPNVPIRLAAALAALVGLDLVVSTYPGGRPIRDVAQVRLMARLTERIGRDWRWSFEVPLPVPGDQRAWDAVVTHRASRERFGLEAVTRIHDLQALLRRISSSWSPTQERTAGASRRARLCLARHSRPARVPP